ncbi:CueP family metal-binding protein [Bacillus sp. SM2101]|uniref:CueP family metal-binding protein n=1 Tax=Bacillus sp. SM2101 TaxID=2805366 RepID=UPI001BDDFE74|nr:CueP family metal-binding protein [Bacillus sp. SM2101]
MKLKSVFVVLSTAFLLVGCSEENTQTQSQQEMDPQSIKDLVNDYSIGNIDAENASITSEQLIVEETSGEKREYDLPDDEFFVSIAPYVKNTHPCTNHSLTGCQGELANEQFDVVIVDASGNIIIEETMVSGENGFIDMWLPRDKEYEVRITHDGKMAENNFSTYKTDQTCMTTMQLM